jgi:AcrR family transcriptional regulator
MATAKSEVKSTRENIVQLAQEMIQIRGYNAFSYQDLSDRLKIKKASIHYHFESKEDLGAEVLEGARARFEEWIKSIPDQLSPSERLDLYFERVRAWAKSGNHICLNGMSNAEWVTLPKKMRQCATTYQAMLRNWFTRVLEDGRKLGEFNTKQPVENQVILIQSAIPGALQLARSQDKPEIFDVVRDQIKAILKK